VETRAWPHLPPPRPVLRTHVPTYASSSQVASRDWGVSSVTDSALFARRCSRFGVLVRESVTPHMEDILARGCAAMTACRHSIASSVVVACASHSIIMCLTRGQGEHRVDEVSANENPLICSSADLAMVRRSLRILIDAHHHDWSWQPQPRPIRTGFFSTRIDCWHTVGRMIDLMIARRGELGK
jgi:hypothetical protein